MDHAISILLGIIITVSIAGAAVAYMTNYAISISNDDYGVISHVQLHEDSSASIIVIRYTNSGNIPITDVGLYIPSCDCYFDPEKIESPIIKPHTSGYIQWYEFNQDVSGIINMNFTFADGTVITDIQKLR